MSPSISSTPAVRQAARSAASRRSPDDGDRSGSDAAAADLDADGHALRPPIVELEAGPVLGAIVDKDTDTLCLFLTVWRIGPMR
jgi:hypothetical protein